jgi:hypothetical protein
LRGETSDSAMQKKERRFRETKNKKMPILGIEPRIFSCRNRRIRVRRCTTKPNGPISMILRISPYVRAVSRQLSGDRNAVAPFRAEAKTSRVPVVFRVAILNFNSSTLITGPLSIATPSVEFLNCRFEFAAKSSRWSVSPLSVIAKAGPVQLRVSAPMTCRTVAGCTPWSRLGSQLMRYFAVAYAGLGSGRKLGAELDVVASGNTALSNQERGG